MRHPKYFSLCVLTIVALAASCGQKEPKIAPQVSSVTITDSVQADYESVTIKSDVTGNVSAERLVIEYSKDQFLGGASKKTAEKQGEGFTFVIEGLEIQTTYYYRYTVENKVNSISDDKIRQFKTLDYSAPRVITGAAKDITAQTATIEGKMDFSCGKPVLEQGFYYGADKNALSMMQASTADASFSLSLENLSFGQRYYYQAFAKTDIGIGKGEILDFTTLNGDITLTTGAVSSVTTSAATFSGKIDADGGSVISERGFCYATTASPTVASTKVEITGTLGEFSKDITGLQPAAKYYVRVYAINAKGTQYGNEVSFETNPIRVSSITLNESLVQLKQNQTKQLVATVYPSDATYPAVSWQSSNTSVASISSNGLITAIAEGEAVITASADGKSITCSVVVDNTATGSHEGTGESEWE